MTFCVKCGASKDEIKNHCTVCGYKHLIETEKNHETQLSQALPEKQVNVITTINHEFFHSDNNVYNLISIIILIISILITNALNFLLLLEGDIGYGGDDINFEDLFSIRFFGLILPMIILNCQIVSYFASKSIYIVHNGSVQFNRYDFIPFFIGYLFYAQVDDSLKLHKHLFKLCIIPLGFILLGIALFYLLLNLLVCLAFMTC